MTTTAVLARTHLASANFMMAVAVLAHTPLAGASDDRDEALAAVVQRELRRGVKSALTPTGGAIDACDADADMTVKK